MSGAGDFDEIVAFARGIRNKPAFLAALQPHTTRGSHGTSRDEPEDDPYALDTVAGSALDGTCTRCMVHVHRDQPGTPWRAQVGIVNGDSLMCGGRPVVLDRHGPVEPISLSDDFDEDEFEERGCYCHVTTMPPCAWCVR